MSGGDPRAAAVLRPEASRRPRRGRPALASGKISREKHRRGKTRGVDAEHVRDDVVVDDERHVELLLVEGPQPRRHEGLQIPHLRRRVAPAEPAAEEQRPPERAAAVERGRREPRGRGRVERVGAPVDVLGRRQPVGEEPQALVGPDADERRRGAQPVVVRLSAVVRRAERAAPPRELARAVDALGHPRLDEAVRVGLEDVEHGDVERGLDRVARVGRRRVAAREVAVGRVDALQRRAPGRADAQHVEVAQQALRQRVAARVRRGIARGDEAHAFQGNPLGRAAAAGGPRVLGRLEGGLGGSQRQRPEAAALDELAQEGERARRAVRVRRDEVDLVAEDDERLLVAVERALRLEGPGLPRPAHELAVLREQHRDLGRGRAARARERREVERVAAAAERVRAGHGLAAARRAAEQGAGRRAAVAEARRRERVDERLVAERVGRRDDGVERPGPVDARRRGHGRLPVLPEARRVEVAPFGGGRADVVAQRAAVLLGFVARRGDEGLERRRERGAPVLAVAAAAGPEGGAVGAAPRVGRARGRRGVEAARAAVARRGRAERREGPQGLRGRDGGHELAGRVR